MATRLGEPSEPAILTHDGHEVSAQRGEPLALALIAADRLLLSRSPKLHRPRGPYCLRGACEGCLVRIDGLPNQPACRVPVAGGEVVETQNVLGTRKTDLLAAADFLFPQGVDHHRLMAGVRGVGPLVTGFARRVAGLGRLADHAPAVHRAERIELDTLVVGGGRKGLSAAKTLGARALLVDDGHALGGNLAALEPELGARLIAETRASGARLLSRASVLSLSREPEDAAGRLTALIVDAERTYVARCAHVVLATGKHDAAPAFPNNDLPGIFSARAALWAWRADVLVGSRLAMVGSGRFAERLLQQMSGGVDIVPLDEASIVRAIGRERISGVEVRTERGSRRLKVDALAFDAPGAPSFELAVQAGASVDFDPRAGFFPRVRPGGEVAPGVRLA